MKKLIFDAKASKESRDAALDRVEENAKEEWKLDAMNSINFAARENEEFIVDAVWPYMQEETHENRAMGAMMLKAKKMGWILPTDSFRASIIRSHHATPRRVWKSLIFEGEGVRQLTFEGDLPPRCSHVWETLEDGSRICFECDERAEPVMYAVPCPTTIDDDGYPISP